MLTKTKTMESIPCNILLLTKTKTNLYFVSTKIDSFYVIAEHPTEAQDKLCEILEEAGYGKKEDREILDIRFLASSISFGSENIPILYSRDRLIL